MLETSLLRKAVEIGVMLGVTVYVAVQVRKPDRFAGRVLAMLMNQSHAKLTDRGLSHIQIEQRLHRSRRWVWRRADDRKIGNDSHPRKSFRSRLRCG